MEDRDPDTAVRDAPTEQLQLLLDAVQDYAILTLDPEGVIRSWNRGAVRTMGYSADEVIGKNLQIFYGPDDLAVGKPEAELAIARAKGRVEDEGWRVRKDGSRFWANTVITVLTDRQGGIRGFAKVTRDLTERRNEEERVHRREETFRLLLESAKEYAIFLIDPQGQVVTWNAGAERIKGYAPDEIIGRSFKTFYPEEDVKSGKPEHLLQTARERGSVEDEGWRVRKDGTRFWADVIITAVYDERHVLRGFAKVTRDLTLRRLAEERLRQSEEIFRLLVSSVRDYAIFLLDPEGNVTTWNAGARRIKGYEASEIIGRHFSLFYPKEDVEAGKPEQELRIARERGSVQDEGWRLRKDGSRFVANVLITAVYDEAGALRGFAKVTRDITEQQQAEETRQALLQAEEETRRAEASYLVSQEANRAKDEFLMTLSHELRTPMTAILGWSRLLPSISPHDPTFAEAIASIARSAELQTKLIDDVLDVSRIVSGKLRLNLEVVDVARVVNGAIDAIRASANARKIAVVSSFAPGLGTIVADPTRLQQIIWNLLTNAVRFTPKNGRIDVGGRRVASQVQITVKDSGEGIDPEFLPHIFEPFRQAEHPRTRIHGGLGLGLSIVRHLSEAHGGGSTAQSAGRGKGATFTITLPVGSVSAITPKSAMGQDSTTSPRPNAGRLSGISVLLVDDDLDARQLIRTALQREGAAVTAVESAPLALAQLATLRPDIVVTDIAMPLMDGYALTRQIRDTPNLRDLKVVALTAFPSGRAAAKQGGFDEYLMKPIDPFALVDILVRVHATPRSAR
jgi:PAS domain S-box-containing protein